jgi:2-hydroxy-3-keto-5-methylthiopentenyl-1-phosphate phosphatase
LLNNTNDDDIVVFVGDGHTDYCCAEYADIVFAKSKLAAYCNEKRIPHYPYKTFFDVMYILENCKTNGRLRHRHQAQMKRKTAFEAE